MAADAAPPAAPQAAEAAPEAAPAPPATPAAAEAAPQTAMAAAAPAPTAQPAGEAAPKAAMKAAAPPATPAPTGTPVPPPQPSFVNVRTEASVPSQVQIVFSLRDDEDRAVIVPIEQMRVVTRVYERAVGTTDWEELDPRETNIFIHTAANLELEVVFVLDFTASMAQARVAGGGSGVETMLAAFEEALGGLLETHRVGLVEFHDRNVEPQALSGLTTDREAVLESLSAFMESSYDAGSSRVWDSIAVASRLFTSLEDNPLLARALIFLSDGRDTSSVLGRDEAGEIASDGDIQIYALGVGDVFEEVALEAMVRSTGGVYYPTRELDALKDRLREVVRGLQGRYRLTYTTLRRQGEYQARVEVTLPRGVGVLETKVLDAEEVYGLDTEGRLTIDEPSIDTPQGTAELLVRARYVPRNIRKFRFRLDTDKPVAVTVVPGRLGGIIEGWEVSGPDAAGYFLVEGSEPIEFGNSGPLFEIQVSEFTEKRFQIPVVFDNTIYTAGKRFTHPVEVFLGQRIDPTGRIAFRSNRDGGLDIFSMDFDGANLQNLSRSVYNEFFASWSPEGDRLVFGTDRYRRRELSSMNDDGTVHRRLTVTTSTSYNSLPVWSPDGLKIAFDSNRDGNREIYVMDADGSNPVRQTNDPAADYWPTWSPDSSRIAFTSNRDGNFEIYVLNVTTSNATTSAAGLANLTNDPSSDYRPAWSPDGLQIAFYTSRDGNREVYVMNADGSDPVNLTNHPSDDWYPTWSPGGAHIAFVSFRDGNIEIYVMWDDGQHQRNLTNHPATDTAPSWGPPAP